MRGVAVEIAGEFRFGRPRRVSPGRAELRRGDRRDIREAPFLVAYRRESQRGEARRTAIAQILEPPRAAVRPSLDGIEPGLKLFCHLRHRAHAPTGCAPVSIQP